jgi:hypothetical protein
MTFIPTHAQQLVIIQWMDSCIPKEEDHKISIFGKILGSVGRSETHIFFFWPKRKLWLRPEVTRSLY